MYSYFLENKLPGIVPNSHIHTFMYLCAICAQGSVRLFGCSIAQIPYMNVETRRQNIIILFWK
jgi:hypothetical protein